jgi:hypothetical protein
LKLLVPWKRIVLNKPVPDAQAQRIQTPSGTSLPVLVEVEGTVSTTQRKHEKQGATFESSTAFSDIFSKIPETPNTTFLSRENPKA